ncbi:hypothetical protein [Halobellus inordinatus]|uniref:hypothetical protein n=1 Tax=Halobellus inordinatus TaxID=1126236 RepID=UPI0021159E61|nr:hypothetical protein [Halobellus ramosii]
MNRRALLSATASAAALSMTALSGCTGAVRREMSDRVVMDIATMVFHPASEPWATDGLSASGDATRHAALFTGKLSDVSAIFTDQYPTNERTFDNKLRNTDYSSNFILLYEVRMSRAEAYQVAPTILYDDLGWTGWRTVTAPMARASRDPSELDLSPETEDVIATTVVRYSAEATPRRVRLPVYDEETGALRSEMTVRAES